MTAVPVGSALPKPGGPYSLARTTTDGTVYVAGQTGTHPGTGNLCDGIALQTEQAIMNIRAILANAGCSLADVQKVSVFLADIADFHLMNDIYEKAFSRPYPARTTVQVGLGQGVLVEVDAIAHVGQSRPDHATEVDRSIL